MPIVVINNGLQIPADEVEVQQNWVVLKRIVVKAQERQRGWFIFSKKQTFVCDRLEPFAIINRDDVISVHA
jgi:hypothetical protein